MLLKRVNRYQVKGRNHHGSKERVNGRWWTKGFSRNADSNFVSVWKRYVDDVISAVSVKEVEPHLSHLNSVEPFIQFTFERENECSLPFLDLNVHKTDRENEETSVSLKPIIMQA